MYMTTEGRTQMINLPEDPETGLKFSVESFVEAPGDGRVAVVEGETGAVLLSADLFAPPVVYRMIDKIADTNASMGGMSDEQRVHAAFWSGFFYAEAMGR